MSFDETHLHFNNFCVNLSFVREGVLYDRCADLLQFDEAPEERYTNTMSDLVNHAIEVKLKHPRHLIKVFRRDGVYDVNSLAMDKLLGGTTKDPQ